MERIHIRKATLNDINLLQRIGKQTFFETFSSGNTEENMKKYIEEVFSIEKLQVELNDINSEFFFAAIEENVIGYLKINYGSSQTELKDNEAIEIERIYVLSEFQGKRVGHLLFEKAMEIAAKKNAEYIWLGVWEENKKAIHFYQKHGFVEFSKHVFRLGNDDQTDVMMKKILV